MKDAYDRLADAYATPTPGPLTRARIARTAPRKTLGELITWADKHVKTHKRPTPARQSVPPQLGAVPAFPLVVFMVVALGLVARAVGL